MPQFSCIVSLVLACANPAAALGDSRLELDATTRTVPAANSPAGGPKGPTEAKSPLVVVLAADQIVEGSGGPRVVHDFRARRIYRVAADGLSYADESLFPVLGHRVMEFQNRRKLGGLLKGIAVEGEPLPVPLGEQLFSLDDPDDAAKIDRKVEGGVISYAWQGRPLASWSEKVVAMPAEQRERFAMFIRYRYGGHPAILSALQRLDGVPERLALTIYDLGGTTTTTLLLKSRTEVEGRPFSTDGLRKTVPAVEGPLAPLLREAGDDTPADHARRADAILARAKRALLDKKGLDAFLALTEYGIQVGKPAPGVNQAEIAPLVSNDPDARSLFSALQTPEDARAAASGIRKLQALQGHADEPGRHLLKVFEANNTAATGDLNRAETLFVEAISANRSLAGAWKDLGDLRLRDFDMRGAWICWDLARSISPGHDMVKPINDLESRLVKDHPEYFRLGP